MNARRAIKSIAVVVLVGLALETVHAETTANDQGNEPRAAEAGAAPTDMKVPVSDAAAARDEDKNTPAAEEPGLLKKAVNAASDFYERAKAFVMPSGK